MPHRRSIQSSRSLRPPPAAAAQGDISAADENRDTNVQHWTHVKRTDSHVKLLESHESIATEKEPVGKERHITAEQNHFELSRQGRLEKTKNGDFVNLRPHSAPDVDKKNESITSRETVPKLHVDSVRAHGWKRWTPLPARSLKPSNAELQHNKLSEESVYPDGDSMTQNASIMQKSIEQRKTEDSQTLKAPSDMYGVDRKSSKDSLKDTHHAREPKIEERRAKPVIQYGDYHERLAQKKERRLERKKEKERQRFLSSPTPIHLPEYITVTNLAALLKVRVEAFERRMRGLGFEETNHDHILDAETAGLIATEFNFTPVADTSEGNNILAQLPAKDKSFLPARPPVVTIMGHVDHGKTTLLDWLRKSSVAASEHGGITQHIGAFSVAMPGGKLITFLDTPGHAAFLSMRQRGANVTDIVILVVAADDSVKPQTIEAIKHSQAAKVPIIVAINKIDKDGSNVEQVKQDLARYGVDIEDYGGDTQVVCVSGKTGQGMQELEEATIALADILDLRAEIDGNAEGWVLEVTKKRTGLFATILVRRGTIKPGDFIVAGRSWAKVRSLRNEAGIQVRKAGPGTPIELDGWREHPIAGDEVLQADNERRAKSVVEYRNQLSEKSQMAADVAAMNEHRRLEQEKREQERLAQEVDEAAGVDEQVTIVAEPQSEIKEVYFVVKADVSGSVEAILESVSSLGNSEVRPHILRSGIGTIVQNDIDHAASAQGHIISFNNPTEANIARIAASAGVEILSHNIIYRLIDDVKAKLSQHLTPIITQKVLGEAEIAQVFDINVRGRVMARVAGCKVRNGIIAKPKKIRVLRGTEVIHDGKFPFLSPIPPFVPLLLNPTPLNPLPNLSYTYTQASSTPSNT